MPRDQIAAVAKSKKKVLGMRKVCGHRSERRSKVEDSKTNIHVPTAPSYIYKSGRISSHHVRLHSMLRHERACLQERQCEGPTHKPALHGARHTNSDSSAAATGSRVDHLLTLIATGQTFATRGAIQNFTTRPSVPRGCQPGAPPWPVSATALGAATAPAPSRVELGHRMTRTKRGLTGAFCS